MIDTKRLYDLRKENKLTQAAVANNLGIERTTYVRYENGEIQPPIDMLLAIADFYNTSTDYLLGKTFIREPQPELVVPDELKNVKVAFHGGEDDLTQDEVDKVAEYVRFIKSQRREEKS